MSPYFILFGFGYIAKALAPRLVSKGFKVIGTSRSLNQPAQHGLDIKLIDFNTKDMETYVSLATHLLISIPPTPTISDPVLMRYGELIKHQAPHLKWIGYLSSTGVYGNHDGNWVDEESKCIPHTPSGINRLQAEQAWSSFAHKHDLPLHLFRLSGIYGPGRNVLQRLAQGKARSIFKEHQVFCRIHVDDIVTTLLASIESPNPLAIYNVADDEPAPSHVIDQYAAKLLHLEPLPLIHYTEAFLSPMEQEFYANNRRVSNLKIKNELAVALQYPTYKEGLSQIWRNDHAPK